MIKPNKLILREWVKALRSGGFKQGRKALRRRSDGPLPPFYHHCCLGVLCELHKHAELGDWESLATVFQYRASDDQNNLSSALLPLSVAAWAGLPNNGNNYTTLCAGPLEGRSQSFSPTVKVNKKELKKLAEKYAAYADEHADSLQIPLTALNDSELFTFEEIADIIERHFKLKPRKAKSND